MLSLGVGNGLGGMNQVHERDWQYVLPGLSLGCGVDLA